VTKPYCFRSQSLLSLSLHFIVYWYDLHTAPLRYHRCRRNRGDEFEGGSVWVSRRPPSTSQEWEARMCHPAPLSSSRTAGDNDIPRRCPQDLPPHPPCCDENSGEQRRASRCRRSPPHPFPPLLAFLPIIPLSLLMSPVAGTFGRDVALDVIVVRVVVVCR